jgi:hypothetical protein
MTGGRIGGLLLCRAPAAKCERQAEVSQGGACMALEGHILHLSNQHKKIQDIIESEMANPDWDELRVAALKKQKLRIKDELERLRATVN